MEIRIPIAALKERAEDGAEMAPEQGDEVTLTVDGTIELIDGETAVVRPTMANGEPVQGETPMDELAEGEAPGMTDGDEGAALAAEIERMQEKRGY